MAGSPERYPLFELLIDQTLGVMSAHLEELEFEDGIRVHLQSGIQV
jgi:hypothetical protein